MERFLGKSVLLVGEVINVDQSSSQVTVSASDGVTVQCFLPPGEACEEKFIQFIGKVCPNHCLEVFKIIQMASGNNFDMSLYDKVVELSNNKFSHLFV
eukprot:CAMPEP_0119039008 /NCGR_PEP_ID=MMETSP1177-20130426/8257_1 /TAXON_ID=2985 /ORGANISM="Ochromonas sp, Strain CCMP1899" /LENGTH=97 /DNA_ID=CAMNT_0007002321 /DNA_START=134 /DNA_END=427 /DNA_ORIENTATION=-